MTLDADISMWDPRTQEIVGKYGFETYRYDAWKSVYGCNTRDIELEYLRHVGQEVLQRSLEQGNQYSYGYDMKGAIETSREARRIFLLFKELDTSQAYSRRWYVQQLLEGLDSYLSSSSNEK